MTEKSLSESLKQAVPRDFPINLISSSLDQADDYGLYCLFDPQSQSYRDKKTLQTQFEKAVKKISGRPWGIKLLNKIRILNDKDFTPQMIITEIESIVSESDHSEASKFIVDNFLATILKDIVSHSKRIKHPPLQLLNFLLYYFVEQQPEFLLIVDSFTQIILNEEGLFSREIIQKTADVATLNYRPRVLYIYIACDPFLNDRQKNSLFQILTAYEKIKRLLFFYQQKDLQVAFSSEDFYLQRESKDRVARDWFKMSYAKAKKDQDLYAAFNENKFIKRYLNRVVNKQKDEAERIAKALVLFVNDEDIIRMVNDFLNNDLDFKDFKNDRRFINRTYRMFYTVMQSYKKICDKSLEEVRVQQFFRQMALESRISILSFLKEQYMPGTEAAGFITEDTEEEELVLTGDYVYFNALDGTDDNIATHLHEKPVTNYALLHKTSTNLKKWSLRPLFEVYPIPPEAQQIFNMLCQIGYTLAREVRADKLDFLLYIEKVLELLQQIESLGIKIIAPESNGDPIIYNTVQLSAQGLVKKEDKDTYLISSGFWREQNKTKPGVFKIFGPCSMTNCAGNYMVSLGLQILTSSGHFYAAPIALDHTLRYPQDYELHEPCRERAGWIPIQLPHRLRKKWDETQQYQLETTNLLQIIDETIKKANDPSNKEILPVGNIDGFWDA